MIPNKSNTTNGCDNTSSNCVIWQGPDLPCVNVCNGDTISDILAKMCEVLINTTSTSTGVDISTINQLCLEETYGVANNVQGLIQNIITEVCTINNHPGTDPCSCVIPLPPCLQYRDEQGNFISTLPLHDPNTGTGYAVMLANNICANIAAIDQLQNASTGHEGRIVALEKRPAGERYIAPKVVPSFVGKVGVPSSLENVLRLTEESVGELQRATGSPTAISNALNVAPNLNGRDRLSGKGTMSAIAQWNNNAINMAQSFQNLWITMNDTRNAVQSIKETVANPLCGDVTFDVKGHINRNAEGAFVAISLDFTDTSIPTDYTSCDSRGTKVTITDSSLNSIVKYVDVVQFYQNNGVFGLATGEMGNLDLGSNYSVKVEFCVSNGENQCSEIYPFTIDNELQCPNLDIGTVTADTIPFSISGVRIPSGKGHTLSVVLKSSAGSVIDSRSFSTFSSGVSGNFTNLVGSTSYQITVEIQRSGSSTPIVCATSTVSTTAPACAHEHKIPATTGWFTSTTAETNLQQGANTIEIASYNDGVTQTKWKVGFDTTNTPIVTQQSGYTDVSGWNHAGSFLANEYSTAALVIGGLATSPLVPSGITRADKESGWKYMGSLMSPNSTLLYIYASIDTSSHTVNDVIFACNCTGLYIDTPQPVFYTKIGGSVVTEIDAIGYTEGDEGYTWSITSQPSHGTVSSVGGYPTKSKTKYLYGQNGDNMISDSFTVSLTNQCGQVVSNKIVSILPAKPIRYTTSEIVVFFDTTTMTTTRANTIKASFLDTINQMSSSSPTPNIYFIAVQGTNAGDYLKHPKGLVERINGNTEYSAGNKSIDIPTVGAWYTDVMASGATLPAWFTGSTNVFPPDIKIISFVNKMSSTSGAYTSATTVPVVPSWAGFGPTTSNWANPHLYSEDYACISDMLPSSIPTTGNRQPWTVLVQAISAIPWTTGSIPFTFDQVVIPIIQDSAGTSAVAALQQATAINGEDLLTPQELGGQKFGLREYGFDGASGININEYLNSAATGTPLPYSGTTSSSGGGIALTIQGLKDLTSSSIISHNYFENNDDFNTTTNTKILGFIRGMFGMDQDGSGQPTNKGFGYIGGKGTLFGISDVAGAPGRAAACVNANPGVVSIYTSAGVDTSGGSADCFSSIAESRAYLSPTAAANNIAGIEELTNDRWYAINPGTGSVSYIAQYKTTAVVGKHWTGITQCT
tara:strand:- start:1967 stop:5572 length:3606 start_codon:yes stop_codon:yes gene_type:complete